MQFHIKVHVVLPKSQLDENKHYLFFVLSVSVPLRCVNLNVHLKYPESHRINKNSI